jgi:hypothetical protein
MVCQPSIGTMLGACHILTAYALDYIVTYAGEWLKIDQQARNLRGLVIC